MASRRALLLLALVCSVSPRAQSNELDVNTASQAQLESLPGVGPSLAERILQARQSGPFADWPDLRKRVKGIGASTAKKLSGAGLRIQGRPYVSVTTQSG
jgi:competence protein ComEA